MERHVQGQARLSDARASGKDDQVRRLEPAEQGVEPGQAGGDAEDLAAVLVEILEPVIRLAEEGAQRLEAGHRPALADLEQDGLGLIDGRGRVVGLLVAHRRDLPRGRDQVPEDRLLLDDPPVVLDVDGGRDRVHEGGQVRRATNALEPVVAGQLVAQGDEVDGLALGVEGQHGLVDVRVLGAVEIGPVQEVGDLEDGLGVDQDRPEHALLGFDRLGGDAVNAHRLWEPYGHPAPARKRPYHQCANSVGDNGPQPVGPRWRTRRS